MAKDRRSRDQKRKDKLAKKKRKARQPESFAYMGDKYKTDELVPLWLETETGIYEAFVMTDRKLLDQTVVTALETLVKKIRAGTLPPVEETSEVEYKAGHEADLVIANIRRRWAHHFETEWRPPKDKRIGVLRTILGSIEKMRGPGPRSQSYMHHIAGFLTKKVGISVERVSADQQPLPKADDDELLQLGRRWSGDEDQYARVPFYELAADLIHNGQAERVINVCHQLVGEESDPSSTAAAELIEFIQQVRQSHIIAMG